MEIKKSPKADLENKRSMFILIGFVLAFGFTYICFEWTNTEVTVHEVEDTFINQSEDLIIPHHRTNHRTVHHHHQTNFQNHHRMNHHFRNQHHRRPQ